MVADKIFVVEDDDALRRELSRLLEQQGFVAASCDGSGSPDEVAACVLEHDPDCIVLDLMLPQASGHSVCRVIRQTSQTPIIMLTSSNQELDEVIGFGSGADDYVTKPYSPATLIARIQAQLRRTRPASAMTVSHAGVTLDLAAGTVASNGSTAQLTRNELRILNMLMRNHGAIISRSELMNELWQSDEFIDDNTLTVNINRLRKTLEGIGVPGDFITTRRNLGYVVC